MSKLPFLLIRHSNDLPDEEAVMRRLRRHLLRLRGVGLTSGSLTDLDRALDILTSEDCARTRARARRYLERLRVSSGMGHLDSVPGGGVGGRVRSPRRSAARGRGWRWRSPKC
jgi:hypothetical protein